MSNFSFIIPVYNEEQTIRKVILDIQKKCSEIEKINDYEILVVDDNSNDNSNQIISEFKDVKYFKNFIGLKNISLGGLILIVPKGFQLPLLSLVPKSLSFNLLAI